MINTQSIAQAIDLAHDLGYVIKRVEFSSDLLYETLIALGYSEYSIMADKIPQSYGLAWDCVGGSGICNLVCERQCSTYRDDAEVRLPIDQAKSDADLVREANAEVEEALR